MDHRIILYRMEACRREHRRSLATARTRTAGADPDVRRTVAQHAQGRRNPAGELPRPWKTAGGGRGDNFPEECRYVLETLGGVYHYDALAREQELSPEQRLRFHQEHSGPLEKALHEWMETQLAEHKTEPNSGLGKAISYLLNHWTK